MRTSLLTVTGALALALLAGCTVKEVEPPSLAGPSTLAQSLSISAVPDSILQDQSSSTIVVLARGPNGQGIDGLRLRAQVFVNDVARDFGTLAPKETITGGGATRGEARFVYTAPSRPVESVGIGTRVTIRVTPVGTDSGNLTPSDVHVNVIPPGVILPPNGAPVAAFVVTPTPITSGVVLNFDASGSTDEGVACGANCTYSWIFGDGTTGSGIRTTHTYRGVGTFNVVLSVTDARGMAASTTQALSVSAATPPTASFLMSPTPVGINQDVFFNAEQSRAVLPRTIVSYGWNFGDGRTGSGVTVSRNFPTNGSYNIVLTVTDDVGAMAQTSQALTVATAGAGPTAGTVTVSPTPVVRNAPAFFNASAFTAGTAPIVSYRFNYGDGTPDDVGVSATQSHTFAAAGTYTVRVTATDSLGRTATATLTVAVSAPGPVPAFTVTPSPAAAGAVVTLDASTTTTTGTAAITSYTWTASGGAGAITAGQITTKTFAVAGTYVVTLTVRDAANVEVSTSRSVTIQ